MKQEVKKKAGAFPSFEIAGGEEIIVNTIRYFGSI